MIPSTRALTLGPQDDDTVTRTESMGAVTASNIDTGFDQEGEGPEIIENEDGSATVLPFRAAKARVEGDKEAFDAACLALSRSGTACMHHHDHAAWLAPHDRDKLVFDGRQTYYVGIGLRSA